MQNHLISDPWFDDSLYYIDENLIVTKIVLDNIDVSEHCFHSSEILFLI